MQGRPSSEICHNPLCFLSFSHAQLECWPKVSYLSWPEVEVSSLWKTGQWSIFMFFTMLQLTEQILLKAKEKDGSVENMS